MSQIGDVAGMRASATRDPRTRYWCGPSALAAITGIEYYQACFAISMQRGTPFKNSAKLSELSAVLVQRGYEVERHPVDPMTLAEFMRSRPDELRNAVLLLCVTGHFVVVQGDKVCDSSYTAGKVMAFDAIKRGKGVKLTTVLIIHPKVPA